MRREHERHRRLTRRALLLAGGQAVAFGALAARMYQLQVIDSEKYKTLADDNRISVRLLPPMRGLIVDRFGEPLALNRQDYRIVIVPEQAGNLEATLAALGDLVPVADHDRQRVLRAAKRNRSFIPQLVREGLTLDEVARISVNAPELPGVSIEVAQTRLHPQGATMAHVVGYVGAVAENELTGDPMLSLPGFRIGKAGVERSQDRPLRGMAGTTEIEVNAVGRVVRELGRKDGAPGQEVQLTIDTMLQSYVLQRLGKQIGACVVLDVHTGEVIAMASTPTYDPGLFAQGIRMEDWRALITNKLSPLTNKCVGGAYAPGSTFKVCVALAGLENGVSARQTFTCTGALELGDAKFHCWRKGGHGTLDMQDALMHSCDCYFYELARRIGIDRIAATAKRLGLGVQCGVDLPGEQTGLVPTRDWKRAKTGVAWQQGETIVCGIGQGYVTATPLQLAVMTARVCNGGKAVVPHVVRRTGSARAGPEPRSAIPTMGMSPEHLRVVMRGMSAVTNNPRGTAYKARIAEADMAMAGKTGTSQVRRISMAERRTGVRKNEDLPWLERDHALFVCFAPVDAPRYACSIIIEHGGGGSAVAAPIARDIMVEVQKRDPVRRAPGAPQVSQTPSPREPA